MAISTRDRLMLELRSQSDRLAELERQAATMRRFHEDGESGLSLRERSHEVKASRRLSHEDGESGLRVRSLKHHTLRPRSSTKEDSPRTMSTAISSDEDVAAREAQGQIGVCQHGAAATLEELRKLLKDARAEQAHAEASREAARQSAARLRARLHEVRSPSGFMAACLPACCRSIHFR